MVRVSVRLYLSALNVPRLDTSVWPVVFAADDFIRTRTVTGVQTCDLPFSAVPPLSFVTILSSTSDGGLSLLMMVHIALSPLASVIVLLTTGDRKSVV